MARTQPRLSSHEPCGRESATSRAWAFIPHTVKIKAGRVGDRPASTGR